MTEEIRDPYTDELVAIIIPPDCGSDQTLTWLTPDDEPFQLGYQIRPAHYFVRPHKHKQRIRYIYKTRETLFIQSGVAMVDLYDTKAKLMCTRTCGPGTAIWLGAGGHGIRTTENTQFCEVKQGPAVSRQEDKVDI